MRSRFPKVRFYKVVWSPRYMASNFSRFLEKKITLKEIQKRYGTGPFMVCIFEGESRSLQDVIYKYRNEVEHDVLYTSATVEKANRDITLLFGFNYEDMMNTSSRNGVEIEILKKDLEGASGWSSISQVFYVMSNTLEYCILRNADTIKDGYNFDTQGDIDILVKDLDAAKYILNGKKYLSDYLKPGMFLLNVGGMDTEFDMSYVGDGYIDMKRQKDILKSVRMQNQGVPLMLMSPVHQYFTLLYHAYVHKKHLTADYHRKLMKNAFPIGATYKDDVSFCMAQLNDFMLNNGYHFTIPSSMEGVVNWSSLKYVDSYGCLRMEYLFTRKLRSEWRRVMRTIQNRIKI